MSPVRQYPTEYLRNRMAIEVMDRIEILNVLYHHAALAPTSRVRRALAANWSVESVTCLCTSFTPLSALIGFHLSYEDLFDCVLLKDLLQTQSTEYLVYVFGHDWNTV